MRKCDVIEAIDDMISKLYKQNQNGASNSVRHHNNGGIYYLRELKFKIEKMGTKKEKEQ